MLYIGINQGTTNNTSSISSVLKSQLPVASSTDTIYMLDNFHIVPNPILRVKIRTKSLNPFLPILLTILPNLERYNLDPPSQDLPVILASPQIWSSVLNATQVGLVISLPKSILLNKTGIVPYTPITELLLLMQRPPDKYSPAGLMSKN